MGRWEPDPRGRLERAALELFEERGFDAATVPQITERAGLTTRTFFRHFADKREVLFASADELRDQLVAIVRDAPPGLMHAELLEHGLEAASQLFATRFDDVRRWRSIVEGDESLRERQVRKQHLSIEAMHRTLVERGLDDEVAGVMAMLAVLLMDRAVGRWVEQPAQKRPLIAYVRDAIVGLRSLV